ncbi:hypothetical protein NBRC10512_008010 [Rhodotorula toruloides]|uniref:RHTO0S04e01838g1_1 n=2 Tax=Rhodotorula toruloides TaxID=5286 RepID=A0A061APP3_RHOTO|nr:uncharacterized protein RHTO_02589 [Rhodotorula toruloides NP11]EMS20641.1 hypothetical protein RHTO_02589 [Rhodotorula toruloides NP11]KAJ8296896.1 hypothetical protein OF846_000168 [Rhodotorula toruloides]CDR39125.1 RHTO0S04e01838g1_1 [Rhodotorula toruloides]
MALTQAKLPAPLRLAATRQTPLSHREAHSQLRAFLSSDASSLLSGSGAVSRAALVRLVQGLADELDAPRPAAIAQKEDVEVKAEGADEDKQKQKKRRKSDKGGAEGSEKKKRRKVEA